MEKTNGSPFFVGQMIKSLLNKSLIFFSSNRRKWGWDQAKLFGDNDMSKSVLELLRLNILALDEYTQQALVVASMLGDSFSLKTLNIVVNRPDSIESALTTGMIAQQNGSDRYRFVHDQIQIAAFKLLPEDPSQIYLHIGKKLWRLYSEKELDENIFLVVHLLHNAIDLITGQDECVRVARLFLEAGEKALTSTAFTQAFGHLESGESQ